MRRVARICFVAAFLVSAVVAQDEPLPKWMQDFQRESAPKLLLDYGQLSVYREANGKLGPPAPREDRVVFLGDSITAGWDLEKSFRGKPFINRGIGWQNTAQMVIRFRRDVLSLKPKVVVILAGTNDISGAYGPMSLQEIQDNFESLTDLGRANGVQVVLSSILPVHNYTPDSQDMYRVRPREKIRTLNNWLQNYCSDGRCVYLDYFSAMVDDKGLMRKDFAEDGVHPTDTGYAVMAPLAEKAIRMAIGGENNAH